MELGEKLNLMRNLKGLTQEDVAEKLNMSTTGYAKIERGETKLQNPRLEKIAKVLDIELTDLLNPNGKGVFHAYFRGNKSLHEAENIYLSSAIELIQELEKMAATLQAKDREIELLNDKIRDLNRFIQLLEKTQS